MRSDMVSASSWSCVTYTNVMPKPALQSRELVLHLLAELEVERAKRLVEQQHRWAGSPGRAPAPRVAAGRRRAGAAAGLSNPISAPARSISRTAR